jgi:putative N6-adenine-specific DNA methylase
MYEYQDNGEYFAQVAGKSELLCAEELEQLGASIAKVEFRGVQFKCDMRTMYKINYNSRLASRILAPIKQIDASDEKALYRSAMQINWEEFFSHEETFSINTTAFGSKMNNSLYISQMVKDGIADYFRNKYSIRPSVDTKNPDIRINLHIVNSEGTVSIDCSGESLHRRGYRLEAGPAPMQETVAAAIIRLTRWEGENTFWDPMCGAGTILCEALMSYCKIPAQYLRKSFGFFNLPDYEEELWQEVKEEGNKGIRELPDGLIKGSDKSQKILVAAKDNLSRLPYGDKVELAGQPFQHIENFNEGTIVTNPPYGIRLGDRADVEKLYGEFGDFIKTRCKGSTAWIYMGDVNLRKTIGLRTSRRFPLVNGKLDGVLVKIESYEGSKKAKYREDKSDNEKNSDD